MTSGTRGISRDVLQFARQSFVRQKRKLRAGARGPEGQEREEEEKKGEEEAPSYRGRGRRRGPRPARGDELGGTRAIAL